MMGVQLRLVRPRVAATLVLLAGGLLVCLAGPIRSQPTPRVEFRQQGPELQIRIGGESVASYVHTDPKIPRPYFAHLRAPGGIQVSRNHPPIAGVDATDHDTFHPGLWMAFGDLSGADSWRLKAPVRHGEFLEAPRVQGEWGRFRVLNRYFATDGTTPILTERTRYGISRRAAGHLITWDSDLEPVGEEAVFGDQEEMGVGVRMATPLTVRAGGTMVDAAGNRNEREVRGKNTPWCDYSGTIQGRRVGITLMSHPRNFRSAWWHARDYGFLTLNPFGRKSLTGGEVSRVVVRRGEPLRLRFGVLLHSSPAEQSQADLAAAYREFARLLE